MNKNGSTPHLLSFIMPNYNYGQFIAEAIASAAAQDYVPIEIIIIDDASTDNSLDEIRRALGQTNAFSRVEVIALSENVGKIGAINRALEKIQGEYCIILDSDDLLTPGYATRCIDELVAARQGAPHIGFVYTDCNLISAEGKTLSRGKSTAFDPALLKQYSFVPEPAVVLSQAMIEASPLDETVRKGTKHHKWKRIVSNGWWGKHIAEPLFYYRMHDANISGIGKAVLAEVARGQNHHRILSGYWPTELRQEAS